MWFAERESQWNNMKTQLIQPNVGFDIISNKLFDEFFGPSFVKTFNVLNSVDPYPVDQYWDKDDKLNIEIPLAGYKKQDIKVYVDNGYLIMSANKQEKKQDVRYVSEGIRKKELTRKWVLSDAFDHNEISSKFEDGLLTLTLQKAKPKEPELKYIEIK